MFIYPHPIHHGFSLEDSPQYVAGGDGLNFIKPADQVNFSSDAGGLFPERSDERGLT
jgi:hypothetical protein